MEASKAKLIILHNTSRCGSTLLSNMFKETGRCVCYNEPHCLSSLCNHILTTRLWEGKEAKRVFRDMVRVLCKPYGGLDDSVMAYVIKPSCMCAGSMELFQEVFPDCQQFLMYRDPSAVAVSMRRVGQALVSFRLLYHLPNLPRVLHFWIRLCGYPDTTMRGYTCAVDPGIEIGYRFALGSMHYYLRSIEHGINIRGISYVDLIAEKEEMIAKIFETCGLPRELATRATEALKTDSQRFSPISNEIMAKIMPYVPKLTSRHLAAARNIADEFGVPSPEAWKDETFRLDNSIVP